MNTKLLTACTDEIQTAILELATIHRKAFQYKQLEKYFGTRLQILGLSMPDQRALFKERWSFSDIAPVDKLKIYDAVWKRASIYEMRFQSVFFIVENAKEIEPGLVLQTIDAWMETVDCWPHSDELAKATCIAGGQQPALYKSLIQGWNSSAYPWKRRQSAVALVRSRNAFRQAFDWKELRAIFLNLMVDETYMVQKGLGWALRDTGRVFNKELLLFLDECAPRLSAVAFSTAIEKLDTAEKEHLKQLRKQMRMRKAVK